jgi:hypothetical protein
MAVDITLLRAYTDGSVYTHAVGATPTAPTDASTALNGGFAEVGAISEDGITESTSQDRTDVYIWQNNTLARRIPGQFSKTFKFAAAETKIFNLKSSTPARRWRRPVRVRPCRREGPGDRHPPPGCCMALTAPVSSACTCRSRGHRPR